MELDPVDREIVDRLVADGRLSYRELGDAIGLGASATAERVRALVRRGVITGFTAVVPNAAHAVEAIVDLRLAAEDRRPQFEELVGRLGAVREALHLTGAWDYQLRLACASTAEIDAAIGELKRNGGVRDTQTRIVLHRLRGLS